jgi:hypothetical protein
LALVPWGIYEKLQERLQERGCKKEVVLVLEF